MFSDPIWPGIGLYEIDSIEQIGERPAWLSLILMPPQKL